MIQTFIYDPADRTDDLIVIGGSEAKHIASVLRLKPGEMIRLISGAGEAHICELSEVNPKQATCRIIKSNRNSGEASLSLTLAVGISSASKFDSVIEKGTEVGVSRFVPILSEKGKVKVSEEKGAAKKLERWKRVSEAAVKQSNRSVFPALEAPVSFDTFIKTCKPGQTVLFHPGKNSRSFGPVLSSLDSQELTIITGSESGFSPKEIERAEAVGIPIITMGERILRTETAAVIFAALAIYFFDSIKA